jgi:hypothetical protein
LQKLKQPADIDSGTVSPPRQSALSFPRYRTRQIPPESTRKSPETLKNGFSESISTFLIAEPSSTSPLKSRRPAGIEIDSSSGQHRKTEPPRLAILQPRSNLNDESRPQYWKHSAQIASIDEGIQID